ncbi:hypothetical protein NA78x_004448 [Anatilimnocola sp. NA78]|uniref:hypothetical protein n=1 Tax=Anatilimnocola sp. NA78 TaxID=3415683 RepID=UPI003CE57A1E
MDSINPYESPAVPAQVEQPGAKYLVDQRRLTWREQMRMSQYPITGLWRWISLQLGLARNPTYIHAVPPVREMSADFADMPPGVGEYLLRFKSEAEAMGFRGHWTTITRDEAGHATSSILRMLAADPRLYLEVAFVAIDGSMISRHNLVSATVDGQYIATSNGWPRESRPPVMKPQYLKGMPLEQMLPRHQERLHSFGGEFRPIYHFEDVLAIVEGLIRAYIEFQVARGFYTPLDENAAAPLSNDF